MPGRILVTPRSLTAQGLDCVPELGRLRDLGYELVPGPAGQLPGKEELRTLASDVVGWLAGVEKIDADVLAFAPKLRVIARNGAGTDTIDAAAAKARGVTVLRAAGANARGVAELALTLILAALRNVPAGNATLHNGGWSRIQGKEMSEVRLGIVGYGAIGRTLAELAGLLGASVTFFDPFATADPRGAAAQADTLEDLFGNSDVVSLHAPAPADGKPLVTQHLLRLLPQGAVLINTARETLVDTADTLEALNTGQLATYAIDAFESEPPVLNDLLRHERTILTPHIGAYTASSVTRAVEYAVENLVGFLQKDQG
ncbi:D-3-phosphoglycerate dehydrogenase [Arthrobacter oryzae]|uniref:NAD(P)-dependent oxidoreductase n=1 Tax=Arthrobacter oryzae TaxID=409290 RepID=UPI00277D2B85|nr:NAD(P)-dependent oxidoreductase [Arthrobacter oryzae]MDP9987434.1 D-3-phosphoglycerate dehydrogenase [Arthrobacter oryzae]